MTPADQFLIADCLFVGVGQIDRQEAKNGRESLRSPLTILMP
jgi:hypothetical protein